MWARSTLLPCRPGGGGSHLVVKATAPQESSNLCVERFVSPSGTLPCAAAGELERGLPVVDAVHRLLDGRRVDTPSKQFIPKHAPTAGRDALAVFNPGLGELLVVQQAGPVEAADLVVETDSRKVKSVVEEIARRLAEAREA